MSTSRELSGGGLFRRLAISVAIATLLSGCIEGASFQGAQAPADPPDARPTPADALTDITHSADVLGDSGGVSGDIQPDGRAPDTFRDIPEPPDVQTSADGVSDTPTPVEDVPFVDGGGVDGSSVIADTRDDDVPAQTSPRPGLRPAVFHGVSRGGDFVLRPAASATPAQGESRGGGLRLRTGSELR